MALKRIQSDPIADNTKGWSNQVAQTLDDNFDDVANSRLPTVGGALDDTEFVGDTYSFGGLTAGNGLAYFTTGVLLAGTTEGGLNGEVDGVVTIDGNGEAVVSFVTNAQLEAMYAVSNSAGEGSPEGMVTRSPGAHYFDTVGRIGYVKTSGTGNTGWEIFLEV